MCGRFSLTASADAIAEAFHLDAIPNWQPRYNIAPTQQIPAIVGNREFKTLRWGLIPSWSKDASIGNRLINARAETLAEKPSFRDAFRQRRCLIVTDGFYEWKKTEKGKKQPFYFQLETGEPFAFAGLWERWKTFETCTIITTEANSLMSEVHDRMPVMLDEVGRDRWLDHCASSEAVRSLLQPCPATAMMFHPVGLAVNSPSYDMPECVQPLPQPGESKSLAGRNLA
jgi:putative SOS response-associated peptidase YedK